MNQPRTPGTPPPAVFDIGTGLPADGHQSAAGKALAWLRDRHRKGWRQALTDWLHRVGPEMRRINAHVLGPNGPWFSPAQRHWLAQMAERPLTLYRVTEVRPGQGLTLVDAIDQLAEPVRVQEITGSRSAKVGQLLGARAMRVGEQSCRAPPTATARCANRWCLLPWPRPAATRRQVTPKTPSASRSHSAGWFEPAPRPQMIAGLVRRARRSRGEAPHARADRPDQQRRDGRRRALTAPITDRHLQPVA